MVRAFADTIAAALGRGTQTLEHGSTVHEDSGDIELALVGFTLVLLLPVGDSRTEQFLYSASGFFIRELQDAESLEYLYATHHVSHQAHLARRGGDIAQFGEVLVLTSLLEQFC